jgi:hypothetical protein
MQAIQVIAHSTDCCEGKLNNGMLCKV